MHPLAILAGDVSALLLTTSLIATDATTFFASRSHTAWHRPYKTCLPRPYQTLAPVHRDRSKHSHLSIAAIHCTMIVADSTTEQYATVMDSLISDCTHLEDRAAELENTLRATAQERDAAVAAQTAAERERDQAVQDLEDIEGTFGEEDLREYCEVCNHHWHREYVTWFAHPFETEDGRYVNSACGGCFRQVPVGHGPVV
jgi:hypothetical protein